MFPIPIIAEAAAAANLRFVVIGGHAVNAYAEPRATLDVDFLVRREDKPAWITLLHAEGFKLVQDGEVFLQFIPPYGTAWRLDLMLVNTDTFAKIDSGSQPVKMLGMDARVASPQHLIALKLHALEHGPEERFEKDFGDVINVTRNAKLDPRSESYRQLFQKYSNDELYERVLRRLESTGP